jgi:hypothetical protein
MAFHDGNDYWKLRNTNGRCCIFETPQELGEKANEYFEWIQNNPLVEIDYKGKDAIKVEMPKMRPMTLEGLCNYIDIAKSTFQEYEKKNDFSAITTRIRQIIETQQFEGAASGFLNPSIIARKLGLTDKTEVKLVEEQPLFPDAN